MNNVIRRKRGKKEDLIGLGLNRLRLRNCHQRYVEFAKINLNCFKSVLCQECNKFIHLKKKCLGLESEKQYKPDYRCPQCINDAYGADIDKEEEKLNNHPDKQTKKWENNWKKEKNNGKESTS